MTTTPDDSGPAYPFEPIHSRVMGDGRIESVGYPGMTKLEVFAKDAPEMPVWYRELEYKIPKESIDDGYGEKCKAEIQRVWFKWRWYYAERMVKGDE